MDIGEVVAMNWVGKFKMSGLALLCTVMFALGAWEVRSAPMEDELFILTSFPEKLFSRFKSAFQEKHPSVKVRVLNKKTSAAISHIQDRPTRPVDLFWASAPDAFEVLKKSGHLKWRRLKRGKKPRLVGGYPLDDPDGYYVGFAISGYGIMFNRSYLRKFGLSEPLQWDDLKHPSYYRHLGISAPSRSGTTHLIVETILQSKGWEAGWATLLEIAGNLATVTARSYGVPGGVSGGLFGIGMVIDFFGLSAKAARDDVEFVYPEETFLLPASIAIVKNSPHPVAAAAFINFILSEEGQRILFEPKIRRLPVFPSVYADAPRGYPNPFKQGMVSQKIQFNRELSTARYHLVNSLFDRMITYRVKSLNRAWKAIHEAEKALAGFPRPNLSRRLARARRLAASIPVSEMQASDSKIATMFRRRKPGIALPGNQIKLEASWDKFAEQNQSEAIRLAEGVAAVVALLHKSESQ